MITEHKLADLGLSLPDTYAPVATCAPAKRVGDLLFLSGRGVTVGIEAIVRILP